MSVAQQDKADLFRKLHARPSVFVIPNPWDAGSARILASLGFHALATSSGAMANTFGRRDGNVSREEALTHARAIVEATDIPVSPTWRRGSATRQIRLKGNSFSVAELEAAGVRRISLAKSLYRAAMAGLVAAAREIGENGTFGYLDRCLPSAELNRFMRD